MLKFLMSKPFIGGMIGLTIMTTIYFGYSHYNNLLDDLQLVQAQHAQLRIGLDVEKAAVVQLQVVIEEWEDSQEEILNTVREMQEKAHEATKETRRLQQLFAEINFEDLAPAVADSFINDISYRLWSNIGIASDPAGNHRSSGPPRETSPAIAPANNPDDNPMEGN